MFCHQPIVFAGFTVFICPLCSLQGELRGIRGLVPSNFLEDLSDPADGAHEDSSHDDSYVSEITCLKNNSVFL